MRTLRQLSFTGTATVLASLGLLAIGCAGEDLAPGGMNNIPGGTGTGTTTAGVGGSAATTTAGVDGGVGGSGVNPQTTTTTGGVVPDNSDPSICIPGVPPTSQVSRLLNREYDNVVEDLLGVTGLAGNNNLPPSALLNDDFEGAMNQYAWDAYQNAAAMISSEVMAGTLRTNFIACDPAAAGCFDQTIRDFGHKAFRRPLTEEEVTSFMRLTTIQPAGTPDEIAETILYAFLVSPSFIMTPEMNPTADATTGAIALSSHEVATRLSLMLWGTAPDAELLAAADANQLQTPDQILAQANRMLQDRTQAGPQIGAAHRKYLQMDQATSHWWKMDHDPAIFPAYSQDAIPALEGELEAFFEDVAFTGGGFNDLFLSNVGFVNNQTAPLYGLDPAGYGADLTRVEFDATQRPGFLTRAGFLSSFSSFDATSPILRGAFITVYMIGVNPGLPDPAAALTPIPPGTYTTRREQIEALTAGAECVTCHGQFVNPPGFALENFDAVGNWQTTDPLGGPINSASSVVFSDTDIRDISTPMELMQGILDQPVSKDIYAEQLVASAYGRLPNSNDACIVDDLAVKLSTEGYGILNLFADLTQSDSFRLRTIGE